MHVTAKGVAAVASVAVTLTLIPFTSPPANAIPAWARRYDMDCSSCHFGSTYRLTKVGKDFWLRGHRTKDDAGIQDLGDVQIAKYTSFTSKFRFYADKDAEPSTKFDVESLSIYSGGPIADNFSYFFEIYLHERGKEASSTGGQTDTAVREKLAEAYLLYNSDPAGDGFWFARAGQISSRLIHQASTGARTSLSRPRIINDNVGGGNLYTPRDRAYGISAGLVTPDAFIAEFGIVNGGGGNARPNQPEMNNFKDLFASFEKEFDDYGSSVGVYGYTGKYPISGTPAWEDGFLRYGVLASFVRENFEISGAWMRGENDLQAGGTRNPEGYYLEGAFIANEDFTFYARYDNFLADLSSAPRKTGGVIGVSYRLPGLGRMALEGGQTKTQGGATTENLLFEISWGF
ncbi:MAG: hypothetical protein HRF45_12030 [Fimbriimonadia bacterium]|jgi:hypothetical protein